MLQQFRLLKEIKVVGNNVFSSLFICAFSDDGTTNSIVGAAKVKDPAQPAKLEVSFSGCK